jgi:hypothetical protein
MKGFKVWPAPMRAVEVTSEMGNGYRLGDVFIRRFTVEDGPFKAVYHYTTKVIEVKENKITALDGFSYTDYGYMARMLPEGYRVMFRMPKYGNSVVIVDGKDGIIIPMMSYDIMAFDADTAKYYLRPFRKKLGLRDLDDLRKNVIVSNQYGEFVKAETVNPQYFPYLRELRGDKPDLSIVLRYNVNNKWIVKNYLDIYGKYYFVLTDFQNRNVLFLGYVQDIYNIIPPIRPVKERLDLWRSHSKPVDLEGGDWIRLTNYEWAGTMTQSAAALENLEDALKKLVAKGVFKAMATVISYTSNIFVVYVDFYVKPYALDNKTVSIVENIKSAVDRIEKLESWEIMKNLLNL